MSNCAFCLSVGTCTNILYNANWNWNSMSCKLQSLAQFVPRAALSQAIPTHGSRINIGLEQFSSSHSVLGIKSSTVWSGSFHASCHQWYNAVPGTFNLQVKTWITSPNSILSPVWIEAYRDDSYTFPHSACETPKRSHLHPTLTSIFFQLSSDSDWRSLRPGLHSFCLWRELL